MDIIPPYLTRRAFRICLQQIVNTCISYRMVVNITHGSTDIERVLERRKEIEDELKDAKRRIFALTSEDHELEIAERVILRLTGALIRRPRASLIQPPRLAVVASHYEAERHGGRRRYPSPPSLPCPPRQPP